MSRIGNNPVTIKKDTEVKVDGQKVSVTGPKGSLEVELPWQIKAQIEDDTVVVSRESDEKKVKALHGTYRVLIANAIEGVTDGYEKKLELVGVGYRAKIDGGKLSIALGLSHPVIIEPEEGIEVEVPDETHIVIKGIDKEQVGTYAARIREVKKPEPYKGKGIRYEGEHVRRKSPKAAVTAAAE